MLRGLSRTWLLGFGISRVYLVNEGRCLFPRTSTNSPMSAKKSRAARQSTSVDFGVHPHCLSLHPPL